MPLPSMVLKMSQMIKWQRLEHAQGEPYLMQPKEKSVQGFLPPANFVSSQAQQGAYLPHRSAYEICLRYVCLSDS